MITCTYTLAMVLNVWEDYPQKKMLIDTTKWSRGNFVRVLGKVW